MSNEFQYIFSTKRCEISKSLILRFNIDDEDIDKYMCEQLPLFTPIGESCEKSTPSNIQFGIPSEGGYFTGPIYLLTNEFDKIDGHTPIAVKRLSKQIVARSSHLPTYLTPPVKHSSVYCNQSTQTDEADASNVELNSARQQVYPAFFSIDSIDIYTRAILLPIAAYSCRFAFVKNEDHSSLKHFEFILCTTARFMRDNAMLRNSNKTIYPTTDKDLSYLLLADHPDYLIKEISQHPLHHCLYGDCIINWIPQIEPFNDVIDTPQLLVVSYMVYLICFLFAISNSQETASTCFFLSETLESETYKMLLTSVEQLQVKSTPVRADLRMIREQYSRYFMSIPTEEIELNHLDELPSPSALNPLGSNQTVSRPLTPSHVHYTLSDYVFNQH